MRSELEEFLKSYPGGRAKFCEDAAITEGRLSQVVRGEQPSPKLAIQFHRLSRGQIPGSALRPDLWRAPEDVPLPAEVAQ